MTALVPDDTYMNELVKKEIEAALSSVRDGKIDGKIPLKVDLNRTYYGGSESTLTNLDIFSEHIMNVYDLSVDNNGRAINLYLYGKESNKKTTAVIIEDNGPGFNTEDDGEDFINNFMYYRSDKKINSTKNFIGTAGVGAKDANAKLGARQSYEWSDGHGKKCTFILDETSFDRAVDYDLTTEDWEGDSFFRQTVTKLRNPAQKLATQLRSELGEKFAGKLKSHPSVKIYTSGPDRKAEAVEPVDRVVAVKGYDEEFVVSLNGATAEVRIGLSDPDKTTSNQKAWQGFWFRLSRYGIIHVDTNERNTEKVVRLILDENTKTKLKSTTSMHLRNIFVTINCDQFKPTQIKNDLNLDIPQTQDLLKEIGNRPEFIAIINRIEQYNRSHASAKSVTMSSKMMSNLNKIAGAAGLFIGQTLKSYGFAGEYTLNKAATKSVRKIRCGDKIDERRKKSYTPKAPVSKITSSNKIDGRNFDFNISFAALEDEESRYSLQVIDNTAHLTINESYNGFAKICPDYDKVNAGNKELMLYVIDTYGLGLQDLVIKEKMENNNERLIREDWNTLIKMRETAVDKCISSIF